MKAADKSIFYDFAPILTRNGLWNMVIGGRGIGKSYGFKKLMVRDALRNGVEFIYMRRYREELNLAASTFFDDLQANNEFPDYEFEYKGGKFWARPAGSDEKMKVIGHAVPLSIAHQYKSVAFPLVKWMMYDEFIQEKGNAYLPQEVNKLHGFYNTVDRYDGRVRLMMLANSISIMAPHLTYFDIVPEEGRAWYKADEGFLIAHFPDDAQFRNAVLDTRYGRMISKRDIGAMAIGNVFSDNGDHFIARKSARAKYLYTLETSKGAFSVWYDVQEGQLFAQAKRPKGELVLTMHPENVRPGVILVFTSDPRIVRLKEFFKRGLMSFDKAPTRNKLLEIFK